MVKNVATKILILTAVILLIGYLLMTFLGNDKLNGWLLTFSLILFALAVRRYELLKGYSFTIFILATVSLSMYYPQYLTSIGGFKLSKLIIPLMQLIMFGMGTSLSLKDFGGVLNMPRGVFVGLISQFTIMPFIGWGIASAFNFPSEIAAGIILIGSCPSGLASNVMSYLARANLALSVTLTAIATMLAPIVTPFYMQFLAGEYVEIDFLSMMWDISKIVIIPICIGLMFNHFLHGKFKWLDRAMPVVSMIGISLIIGVITAAGRDDLLIIGPVLILAVFIHNLTGYSVGYWFSRLIRLSEQDCRTIALEVGLQNGGLASGLALAMGKLSTVGLAPAIFSSLMNITGSSLALWWRNKPLPENAIDKQEEHAYEHGNKFGTNKI